MTRINTNVSSLVAQNRLNSSNNDLNSALTRLSTGLRINSGSDDPAGLIAAEALRSEITGLGKAITNTQRASQIISTADSALGQVGSLLNDVRGLVTEAANSGALSNEEIAANQLQIDSSLEAIDRIAQTTTFQGRRLLDGSLDYTSTAGSASSVSDVNISRASIGSTGKLDVEVVVSASATQGEVTASAAGFSAAAAATTTAAETFGTVTQDLVGTAGAEIVGQGLKSISFVNDADAANAGEASFDESTGVLTITGDFEAGAGTNATSAAIITAIDDLDGFTATAATTTGTGADTTPTAVDVTADQAGLTVTATENGSDFNNVSVVFTNTAAAPSADFDSEQKVLTVNLQDGAEISAADLETLIDGATVDGAAPASPAFSASALADSEFNGSTAIDSVTTGTTGGEVLNDSLVFQLSGSDGAETFNFGAGTSKDQIAAAVNLVADSTGVGASIESGALSFTTSGFGSSSTASLDVISEGGNGGFEASLSANSSSGTDIVASVNGFNATGNGNSLSINTSSLSLDLTLDNSGDNFSFSITGGGATFQLGPGVSSSQQANLGIGSVSTGKLGGASGRLYELGTGQAKSLTNDVGGAANIIDEVIGKVTALRGRLGAFQSTTLDSNLVSLNDSRANLLDAESSIRDADFAQESANLTRAQILVQSGTNVLSLANQNPQNALALLG